MLKSLRHHPATAVHISHCISSTNREWYRTVPQADCNDFVHKNDTDTSEISTWQNIKLLRPRKTCARIWSLQTTWPSTEQCKFGNLSGYLERVALTFKSSCFGMIVTLLFFTVSTLPCRLISSPSQTSTVSPGAKLCSLSDLVAFSATTEGESMWHVNLRGLHFKPTSSHSRSISTPSGCSSNFSNSDKVGFTPSTVWTKQNSPHCLESSL